eukprot:gene5218-3965_t
MGTPTSPLFRQKGVENDQKGVRFGQKGIEFDPQITFQLVTPGYRFSPDSAVGYIDVPEFTEKVVKKGPKVVSKWTQKHQIWPKIDKNTPK